MKSFQLLTKDIKSNQFLPIYFLDGEEPFYIDKVTELLELHVLSEEKKGFNQTIVYGKDTTLEDVILLAKQYPMGSENQLIVVKEAQDLAFTEHERDLLENYAKNPQPTTVLVFNYKYKKFDKRQKIGKILSELQYLHTSEKLYDNQVPQWISERVKELAITIDEKSASLLTEFLGNDLSKIDNELKKLKIILGNTGRITPDVIEKHIGISKDYNNFELTKAIGTKDAKKVFAIAQYYEKNPKTNPLVLTTAALFSYFEKLLRYHCVSSQPKGIIAKEIGVNAYFISEYEQAAKYLPIKKVTQAIENLRTLDKKSKGMNATGSVSEGELLREFLYQILYL